MRHTEGDEVVPAQDLLDDRADVWQRRAVTVLGQPVWSNDGVELLVGALLYFRVYDHRAEEREERARCLQRIWRG